MPYICSMRPEYDGVLQVKDLVPNKSQFNPTLGWRSKKPAYINTPQYSVFTTSDLGGNNGLVGLNREISGLMAFIFMEVEYPNWGGGWTRLEWSDMVAWYIQHFANNNFYAPINADYKSGDLEGGFWWWAFEIDMSIDHIRNGILAILGGAKYVVPAGTVWGDGNGNFVAPPTENFFVTNEAKIVGQYFDRSFNNGELKTLTTGEDDTKVAHIWDDNGEDLTGYWDAYNWYND